jgi:hypothetical protein
MKKKSPRGIPDFSSKGPKSARPDKSQPQKPASQPPPTLPQNIKPPATSMKSGRRGQ